MFTLPRVPEPEAMATPEEVAAYTDYLTAPQFLKHDLELIARIMALGVQTGAALDVGCGPGQIACMLAKQCPGLHITGIDLSDAMLLTAAQSASNQGLASRVAFQRCEAGNFGIPDHSIDLLLCNSVLHHMENPAGAFREMERVLKPGGALLVRDLARPGRLTVWWHERWYGRDYKGLMQRMYRQSVRAAYTIEEVRELVRQSGLAPVEFFTEGRLHLGFYREHNKPRKD